MARPRDPTALKVAKGRSHMTKDEIDERMEREVYAAYGEIEPPDWLNGAALRHFRKNADYMERLNGLAGSNVYGSIDSEALALMSVSFQRSKEYLLEEESAKRVNDHDAMAAAQKKRLAEDKSYREFMKLLKLDPGNRVDVKGRSGGDDDGHDQFANV